MGDIYRLMTCVVLCPSDNDVVVGVLSANRRPKTVLFMDDLSMVSILSLFIMMTHIMCRANIDAIGGYNRY